jgi:hypothetical protein
VAELARPVGAAEHLLDHILRGRAVAQHHQREQDHAQRVRLVEAGDRLPRRVLPAGRGLGGGRAVSVST